jgi:pimeloyl-ACP methyl ester carboxylesterase
LPRLTTFEHDQLRFLVTDTGPATGPPVVLLHGFPQRSTCWFDVTDALHGFGYRTLAPDQRGYSPQARPRSRGSYRLSKLVSDVVALIELAGSPVHLVGHDWGAVVAWAVAAGHPDLVRSLVTVSAPHPRAYLRALVTSTQAPRSLYGVAFQLPFLPEAVAASTSLVEQVLRRSGMPEHALLRFRQEIVADGAFGPALGWYRAVPLSGGWPTGSVRVPTTHVWSDGDQALSRTGAQRSGDHVTAPYRLEILTGVSHWIPDEVPAQLAELVHQRARSVDDPS